MSGEVEKRIGMADTHGTVAEVHYSPTDDVGEGMIFLTLSAGGFTARSSPTPDAARQLAAALLDAADCSDEDQL